MSSDAPQTPDPEPVEAQPFDAQADRASGARVRDAGATPADAGNSHAWAMACHLGGLADFAVPYLFLGIVVPLGIWLSRRETDPFVDEHGKEVVNFQLNVLFWAIIFGVLACCLIGIPFLIALPVVEVVLSILGAIAAAEGRHYRYPWILRVIE